MPMSPKSTGSTQVLGIVSTELRTVYVRTPGLTTRSVGGPAVGGKLKYGFVCKQIYKYKKLELSKINLNLNFCCLLMDELYLESNSDEWEMHKALLGFESSSFL